MGRVIVIVLIDRFNRAELGCNSQSYSDRVDIHDLTELNSSAIAWVIVVMLKPSSARLNLSINTITITLPIAPEFSSVNTSIYQHDHYNSDHSTRVQLVKTLYINTIIHVLTELNSGTIVRVIVIVLIYTF
jgi:hypothetical protein